MDFTGDLGSFIFTSGLEPRGEGAQLLAGVFQSFFRTALFGDVAEAADQPQGLAQRITDDESPIQNSRIPLVPATEPVFAAPGTAVALDGSR